MILLGIEASSEVISLGAVDNKRVIFKFKKKMRKGASYIVAYLERYLKKSLLRWEDISSLVIGKGPGSFTSLRVSFSVIKGLAVALNKPVIALGSFFSIAHKLRSKFHKLAVVCDARRNLIYAATFRVRNYTQLIRKRKENLYSLEEFVQLYPDYLYVTYHSHIRENARKIFPQINFYPLDIYPDVIYLLEIAKDFYRRRLFTTLESLEPLYIYPKECQIKNV
ncbi:MAG: tRNA (adenosine(37)-N6)-threonylcarbamoyltransferase complex dimerization subunit type 1 TsaB [Candidatus Omnitrophica bacterium]|nr:tRNA (adenosine(37)-N6)-threonylcarbamoyltransferase complex dimerization subunit type 1 TsaB [Candidatus Omnitrophota bacterium]